MSYTRSLESNHYIYPTDASVVFDGAEVSNECIDVFLYKLYTTRRKEFKERIRNGKNVIKQNKIS